jgi:hypothetical protein
MRQGANRFTRADTIAVAYVPIECHVGMCRRRPRLLEAENRPPTFMSPEFNGDNRVCVFDLVGSLCTIITMPSFGTKILEKLQSSLPDFPAESNTLLVTALEGHTGWTPRGKVLISVSFR